MSRHKLSSADRFFGGSAYNGGLPQAIPGVDFAQMVVVRWGTNTQHGRPAPALAVANNVCAAQAIAGAADATVNGSLATAGVATLDVPRNLQMVSTNAGDTTQTVTVRGRDEYGVSLTETKTLNGTTIVTFLKAFKTVSRVTVSAAMTGNLTVGSGTRLGLPWRMLTGDLLTMKVDNAVDVPTTITVADTTAVATAATGDVRGTIVPSSAPDGTKQYTALLWAPLNDQNALGADQYGA